jgi:hypothetical protein
VDPVPDPLLLRKCGSAGNRTQTSGSVSMYMSLSSKDLDYQRVSTFFGPLCISTEQLPLVGKVSANFCG